LPYGPRPAEEVIAFTREAVRWLASWDCKLIVLACNTATSVALEIVREETEVPVIGVIRPGAAAALAASSRRAIGVLATTGTVRSGAYVRALRDLDPLVDVVQQACPKLVPLVEAGKADSDEAEAAIREYVSPLLQDGAVVSPAVDTLLLGCTHYPLLRERLAKVAGPGVRIVDSAATTALAVREVLESHRLTRAGGEPRHQVFATGPVERFASLTSTIFGRGADGQLIPQVEQADLASGRKP